MRLKGRAFRTSSSPWILDLACRGSCLLGAGSRRRGPRTAEHRDGGPERPGERLRPGGRLYRSCPEPLALEPSRPQPRALECWRRRSGRPGDSVVTSTVR